MTSAPKPILTLEDEAYLREVTTKRESAEQNEQNQTGGPTEVSLQPAISEQPENIPLPTSPGEELGKELGEEGRQERRSSQPTLSRSETPGSEASKPSQKKKRWSAMFWKKNAEKGKDANDANKPEIETATSPTTSDGKDADKDKDTEDMTDILERLNLAADNNRVFSVSEETQELLRKFKLIFKDLINGVPTAYHDLEMLLTNGNRQLQETYTKLPGPMQKLIEKLPERWTETLAPEMLAVAADRAGKSGVNMENVGKAAAAAEKMGVNMPSLKELVSKPAALVGMLRSIMAFLRARFPAVLGMNVLWSLALFILLFVLWYCHKRGREVRLENERLVTEEEIAKLNEDTSEGLIRPTETLTTTALPGASSDEIREGVRKVEEARAAPVEFAAPTEVESESQQNTQQSTRPAAVPTRSKSRLSMFGRAKTEPVPSNVAPYPGT
ncbi:hypothetical protein N7447_008186 [Penicillium robsamsonii]|uniref:uncharacterized protein n=1 Tax=Penicillium robsamsonii TaxID=1792511 RepID=UPI00254676C7|nr:uncharacterized protein N7447_008186 [Penicillium robsamsonii]KAJ5815953.1 hypothetical protein N7447_008186 [Penicillium robsamsonii]